MKSGCLSAKIITDRPPLKESLKLLLAGAEGRDQRRGRGGARGHAETEHESAGPGSGEDGDLGVAPS